MTALLKAVETAAGKLNRLDAPDIDTNAALHKNTYLRVFTEAGIDAELADTLYAAGSDTSYNTFADDMATTFSVLTENGCKIGIVSEIHIDIRPVFANAGLLGLIDSFVLSYEHGVQKPDLAIFRLALHQLGTDPREL